MASNIGEDEAWDETQYFSDIELKIETSFEGVIIKLMNRRDYLLNELKFLRDKFSHDHKHNYESLFKMKQSRNDMRALLAKVESETVNNCFVKALQDLDTNIQTEEHNLSLKLREIWYLWDSNEFDRCLSNLGQVYKKITKNIESGRNYLSIVEPQIRFGRHEKKKGEFSQPRCFCIDEDKYRILVTDSKNSRIQAWTLNGKYLFEFGRKQLKQPWGICGTGGFVFVSDFELNAVLKFNLNDFKLVERTKCKKGINPGQFSSLAGIAVMGGYLYVVEYGNNRISVLTLNLMLERVFGKGLLEQPLCVKTANKFIFVSEMDGTIKYFSQEGKLTKVLKRSHIFSNSVSCFCVDSNLNFLICDRKRSTILVMSQDGKLVISLNCSNWGCGTPFAVELTRDERIVCSLQDGEYSIVII
ncbi:hypothetical protein LOD99_4506 [Oopsacas minuta]|uniref:Uncharacterized protein n=1 Tax=Oopsacas minuta TaxID=111878 RepID=A0AAV7JTH4_9METZ|nr:hypothetical protein LOD99_4506 [Oopsacas minuta]